MTRRLAPLLAALALSIPAPARSQALPGTTPWADRGDPASAMVEGLHRFADRETEANVGRRYTSYAGDNGSTLVLFQITFKTVGQFGFHAF